MLSWPDGGRRLIGTDGLTVEVEPELYGVDARTMAAIDAAVPAAAVVQLPPRQNPPRRDPGAGTGAIAAAREKAAAARASAGSGSSRSSADSASAAAPPQAARIRRTAGQTVAVVLFGILSGLFAFLALAFTVFGADDPETSTGEWIALSGFMWAVSALPAWPAVRILRRTTRM
jgi:hypothetical protein